jgi:hypothetical protein
MVGGILKKEWMVLPSIFKAATPVGARTAIFLVVLAIKERRRVDFPVQAFPVRKRLSLVFSMI